MTISVTEKICLVGWGAIAQRVAALLESRGSPADVIAVAIRNPERSRYVVPQGVSVVNGPGEISACGASLVVEVAARAAVLPYGRVALAAGMDFAVSSTSAFVDNDVLVELVRLAQASGSRLMIPPGALGGIDALAAASRLGMESVEHRIVKPVLAWKGTLAEELCDLPGLSEATAFFEGTAAQAAARFPQNANVAVTTSLASGLGLDRTKVALIADPTATANSHHIIATGDFGSLDVRLVNRPLAGNPKTSEMTALNIVRMIENRSPGVAL